MRVNICGVEIDRYGMDEVVNIIVQHIFSSMTAEYVVTPNAHHIAMLQKNARFREVYQNAFLVVPDGVPLLWAARFLGTPLKERVNGTDLFEKLCAVAAQENLRVFLLGGRSGAAEQAKQKLQQKYPDLQVVGIYSPPYGFELDKAELEQISAKIQAANPHLLFVGLGAPKQEFWMYDHYQELGVPISVGIGVSFELVGDIVKRAPKWMQKVGMEWFFRLLVEPRRLWKRYLIGNIFFIWLVLKQRFRMKLINKR